MFIPLNNVVSRIKHLCLASQTILFHLPNNIVSSAEVKSLESERQKFEVSFSGRKATPTNRKVINRTVKQSHEQKKDAIRRFLSDAVRRKSPVG